MFTFRATERETQTEREYEGAMPNVSDRSVPRWLHAWAILTVAAAVVLLPLGALVTTIKAGMADPVWPTTPWYLVVTPWRGLSVAFLIEHAHRFAGYVVGCCAIVLAIGSWLRGPRWLGWLGIAALLAVTAQGLLGGFRVVLNALIGPEMAAIHGVFGALVFSLLVAVAVLTANRSGETLSPADRRRFGRLTVSVAVVILAQLLLGAVVRHTSARVGPRLHMLGAFAVLAAVVWLARAVWESESARKLLGRSVTVLALFVTIQVMLGVEAWLSKFAAGYFTSEYFLAQLQTPSFAQTAVRTTHFLLGSCILATSVATILLARLAPASSPTADFSAPLSSLRSRSPSAVTTAAATTGLSPAPRLEGSA